MTKFACERERKAALRGAYLQISRLGASAPSLGPDSAAVLLVHLSLPQAMDSKIMMPSPLSADWDRVPSYQSYNSSAPEPMFKGLQQVCQRLRLINS